MAFPCYNKTANLASVTGQFTCVLGGLTAGPARAILEKHAAIGRQIAQEVQRLNPPVESQEIQDYVAKLGAGLAGQFDPALRFTLTVVSTPGNNAMREPFGLPGGQILVPLQLLLTANDEAELAGMLAHAVARGPLLIQSRKGTIPVISSPARAIF